MQENPTASGRCCTATDRESFDYCTITTYSISNQYRCYSTVADSILHFRVSSVFFFVVVWLTLCKSVPQKKCRSAPEYAVLQTTVGNKPGTEKLLPLLAGCCRSWTQCVSKKVCRYWMCGLRRVRLRLNCSGDTNTVLGNAPKIR